MDRNIGENIKAYRKKKGLTQEELGTKCALSKNAIWNYETNRRKPTVATLGDIAAALNCTLLDLLGYDDETSIEMVGYRDISEKIRKPSKEIKLIEDLLTLYGYKVTIYTERDIFSADKAVYTDDGDIDYSKTPYCDIKLNNEDAITLTHDQFIQFKTNIKNLIKFELFKLKEEN